MFTIGHYNLGAHYDTSQVTGLTDYYLLHNLGGTLLLLGEDDKYYSFLARSWEVNRESREITFTLRDGVKFSDGSPILARDVEFTFRRLLRKGCVHLALPRLIQGGESAGELSAPFPGIVALNDRQVRFRFTSLSTISLFIFIQPDGAILSPDQVDPATLEVKHWKTTSGAYTMPVCTPEEHRLKANPHFVFFTPEMLQELRIVRIFSNRDQARALAEGRIQYTLLSAFASEDEYRTVRDSGKVEIIPHNLCATFRIALNKNLPVFRDKRNRQAAFRRLREELGDIRPLKDDRYFIRTNQFIMPTHIGTVGDGEFAAMVKDFPGEFRPVPAARYELPRYLWFVSDDHLKHILDRFKKMGLPIEARDFPLEVIAHQRISTSGPDVPISLLPMFINEKEIHDSIEYMDKMGSFFEENRAPIMQRNTELSVTDDMAMKVALMREINRLIIDDAVSIPFYHIVHQTIINRDYQILHINDFSASPKLWNIRKKSDGGVPAGR